jgi:hypothetical protein
MAKNALCILIILAVLALFWHFFKPIEWELPFP